MNFAIWKKKFCTRGKNELRDMEKKFCTRGKNELRDMEKNNFAQEARMNFAI